MKKVGIVLGILLGGFLLLGIASSNDVDTSNKNTEAIPTYSEEQVVQIKELKLAEENIEIDIKENKDILLYISPLESNTQNIEFYCSNNQVALFTKNMQTSNGNIIYGQIQPVAEGECEIYVSSSGVESNKTKIKVVDKERIEKERKEQEEQAKREAEEKSKKEAEKAASQKATTESPKVQSTTTTQSTDTQQNDNSRTVYITPTGKRYHYLSTCGGKNSTATTLNKAKASGLTPCKKCAQ